jgi:hypothetical protein
MGDARLRAVGCWLSAIGKCFEFRHRAPFTEGGFAKRAFGLDLLDALMQSRVPAAGPPRADSPQLASPISDRVAMSLRGNSPYKSRHFSCRQCIKVGCHNGG